MSDHLPECAERRAEWRWSEDCICDRLRACEQRVRQEVNAPAYLCVACWHRQDGHTCERPERCMCRDCNYAAGLDAAEAAVKALHYGGEPIDVSDWHFARGIKTALLAIDALRGES